MPQPRLRQVDRIAVRASPEDAWLAIRHVDAYKIGFVRALFALRQLPDVVVAKLRGRVAAPSAFSKSGPNGPS